MNFSGGGGKNTSTVMKRFSGNRMLLHIAAALLFASCTAPRTVYHSGKVTPKGQVRAGADVIANFPSATANSIAGNIKDIVNTVKDLDSVNFDNHKEELNEITKSILAYTLDPISAGYDFHIRYGVIERLDIGYKLAGSTSVFDARYQFLGSTGTPDSPGDNSKGFSGSFGIQYSGKSYSLPSFFGLADLDDILGFEMKRKDIFIPVAFSYPFGEEEMYGNVSFGVAYGHTFLSYAITPEKIYEYTQNNVPQLIKPVNEKKSYSSYGGFINIRGGYKYVYVIGSLGIYHQNYGSYTLLKGYTASLKGITVVPSLGLQVNLGGSKKKG
jgi:hypothetical protein